MTTAAEEKIVEFPELDRYPFNARERVIWRIATYRKTIEQNPWIPEDVKGRGLLNNAKQRQFLLYTDMFEVLYGGSAGGGKSYATLMAASQFVDVPGYSALLLRESFPALSKAGAWMSIAQEWWGKTGAKWNERDHRWRFPSGATIEFGYLDSDKAVFQYDGPSFQFIAIDELTLHTEKRYRFMFKPLRKPVNGPLAKVPLRMRAATNPGGIGHDFVKKRWALGNSPKENRHPTALFVPAKLSDNKNLDVEGYKKSSLAELDEITRQQKEFGNWDAVPGGRFLPKWLMKTWAYDKSWPSRNGLSDYIVLSDGERCRHDRCATFQTYDPSASASDAADHFVISTWKITPEAKLIWWDCYRDKMEIPEQLKVAQSLYRQHRPQFLAIEEVLNQRAHTQLLRQSTNPMMVIKGVSPMGKDKLTRALGAINLAASGRLYLPENNPLFPLEDVKSELICFTGLTDKEQSDIVDTLSYCVQILPMVRGGLSHEGGGSAPSIHHSNSQPWDGLR